MRNQIVKRRVVIFSMVALVAVLHLLRAGSYLSGASYRFYYSYFSDFILPFSFYFLLCSAEIDIPPLRPWTFKLAIAFLTPAIAETCQYFGIPALGVTFDPLDYFIYGFGTAFAVFLDTRVFSRVFDFWDYLQK